jgi:hypothetical protein|tara:strand:- start:40105 stop:40293 length:189 start_codon:yes stop_codon:yes gene_type:complete
VKDAGSVFVTMLIGALVGWLAGVIAVSEIYGIRSELKECESELPRNQSCEIVVAARVKEELK